MPTYLAKVSYHDSTFLPSEKILIKWRQQSAALDYVESMSHKIVFDPHLKGLELGIQEQAEKEQLSLSSIGQHPIIHSITIMNKTDFKQTKKVWKFLLFSQKRSSFKFISKTCKSWRKAQCYSWHRLSRQNFGDFIEIIAETLFQHLILGLKALIKFLLNLNILTLLNWKLPMLRIL